MHASTPLSNAHASRVPNHADLRFAAVRDALAQIIADLVPGGTEEAVKKVAKSLRKGLRSQRKRS